MAPSPPVEPRILGIEETDSTNDEARRRAAAGETPPFWVRADRQTRGRGRQGRAWVGLPGNLFLSGCYRLSCSLAEAAQLSFAAALAVADLLDRSVEPSRVAFKWPNDVKLDGAKVAGILLESSISARGVDLVVGVGVNLASAPGVGPQTETGAAAPAIALAQCASGPVPSTAEAALTTAAAFDVWRERWAREGFEPLRTAWLARAEGLGGPVRARLASGPEEGVFEDLDAEGGLVMTTKAGRRIIRSGEVFFGSLAPSTSPPTETA